MFRFRFLRLCVAANGNQSAAETTESPSSTTPTAPSPPTADVVTARPFKVLSTSSLVRTLHADPGKTAAYYATRYFGREHEAEIVHLLWTQIKRFGMAQIERRDGPHSEPCWIPTRQSSIKAQVTRHNPEDEDLSVLRQAPISVTRGLPSASASLPSESSASFASGSLVDKIIESLQPVVLGLVAQNPDRDIHFYIRLLPEEQRPVGALVFKRLRQSHQLERFEAASGAFRWRVAPSS
jgi:hypothetical protein